MYLFVVGIILALFLWNHIFVPFRNPLDIVGPLAEARFNPGVESYIVDRTRHA